MNKNAIVIATKNEKGFVQLYLHVDGMEPTKIEVCDYGGKEKEKAKKLSYALYCKLNGIEKNNGRK